MSNFFLPILTLDHLCFLAFSHPKEFYRPRFCLLIKLLYNYRWINVNETVASSLAVLDIHLPSGYHIMQDELMELSTSRQIKNLRWALTTDKSVLFFFNKVKFLLGLAGRTKLTLESTCFGPLSPLAPM